MPAHTTGDVDGNTDFKVSYTTVPVSNPEETIDQLLWLLFTDLRLTLQHDKRPFGQIRADQIRKAKPRLNKLMDEVITNLPQAWPPPYNKLAPEDFKSGIRMGREGYRAEAEKALSKRLAKLFKGEHE